MDYFSVLFESVCLLAQSAIQLIFMSRLLGKNIEYGVLRYILVLFLFWDLLLSRAQSLTR